MDKLFETPIKAIRKKCLDCTCGQYEEIRNCTVINCTLYPYRMGRRPDKSTVDTIKTYYEKEQALYRVVMVKKRKLSRKKGYFYKAELLFSTAYVELTKTARDLLHCMVYELTFVKNNKNGRYSYPNNGKVSYTERQFKEEFGYSSNTYIKGRNQLIKNGLIRQTYRGGMCRGDMATYKILITPDLRESEMRWLRYPMENWEKEIPKNKNTLVGVKTRFKKKATLKKSTHNGELHPSKLNP